MVLLDTDGEATAPTCPAEVLTKSEALRAPVFVRHHRLWPMVSVLTLSTENGNTDGFGGVPLDFATDAPRGSAGTFTFVCSKSKPVLRFMMGILRLQQI
jgi:hypothetical protein